MPDGLGCTFAPEAYVLLAVNLAYALDLRQPSLFSGLGWSSRPRLGGTRIFRDAYEEVSPSPHVSTHRALPAGIAVLLESFRSICGSSLPASMPLAASCSPLIQQTALL